MTNEQFRLLTRRLEQFAREHPHSYKIRAFLLTILGYAYPLLLLASALAGMILLIHPLIDSFTRQSSIPQTFFVILEILLLFLVGVICRALWVSFPLPEGYRLHEDESPGLFKLVEEVRRRVGAPKPDAIFLDDRLNASVQSIPRLGILGWHRNYLTIGLPLIEIFSPEELRGIIAHEFGHLTAHHGWFGSWIYRTHESWARLENLPQESKAIVRLFWQWFVRRYFPYFSAYTLVLKREHEYQADRCGAESTAKDAYACTLVSLELYNSFLEKRFWRDVYRRADNEPTPPKEIFTLLADTLSNSSQVSFMAEQFQHSIERKTRPADTHPSLADRIKALGARTEKAMYLRILPSVSSADELLSERKSHYSSLFSKTWRARVIQNWRRRHEEAQAASKRLHELEEKSTSETLTDDELWDVADLTAEYKNHDHAIPLIEDFLSRHPEHAEANYRLGRLLLENDDKRGIVHLEKAMNVDSDKVLTGCQMIEDFLLKNGLDRDADAWRERAISHFKTLKLARKERAVITAKDTLEPHDLPTQEVDRICHELAKFSRIKSAYLVRKSVKLLADKPCYVIVVVLKYEVFDSPDTQMLLLRQISQYLGGHYTVISMNTVRFVLNRKIRGVAGSLIYEAIK